MKLTIPSIFKSIATMALLTISTTTSLQAQCTIIGNTECCENEVVSYESPDLGYVYQWNAYNGIISGTGSMITVNWNNPGTGILTLVVKDNLDQIICSNATNVTIYEKPNPIINPSFSSSCSNSIKGDDPSGENENRNPCFSVCDSTWIEYATTNHSGSTYSWTISGNATVVPSTTNTISVLWTGPGNGLVEVTETDSNGCIGNNEICVEILPKPIAAFSSIPAASGGAIMACKDQDIIFNNNSSAGAGSPLWSYTWVFGDGNMETLPASDSSENMTHSYSTPGTYSVMLIAENECHCKDTAYATVIVSSEPGPNISCVSTVCPGSTVTYSTDAVCPAYNWSATNGSIVGDSTQSEVTITWNGSTPAYVSLETLGCSGFCSSPTTVEIPIIDPSAEIHGNKQVCLYACETYSISCNIPVDSIVWHFPGGVSVQTDTINEHEVNVCFYDPAFTGGQIMVEYFHNTPGSTNELSCGGTATLDIKVKPAMYVNYPAEICDSTILTGSYTNLPTGSNQWTISNITGSTTYLSTTLAANAPFEPLWTYGPGVFKITIEDLSGNFCNSPQSFILKVNELPEPPTNIVGPGEICPNVPYQYYAFSTAANYAMQWDFENGNPSANVGQSASVIWENTGPYVASVFQTNPVTGCSSESYSDTIASMLPLSPSTIIGNDTACANGQQNYATSSSGDDFEWTISPSIAGSVVSGQHEPNIVVEWNNFNGTATLTLVRTVCEQSISTNYDIEIIAPPIPAIAVPPVACEGAVVNMLSTASSATFSWDFGDGNVGSGSTVSHIFNSPGNHLVTVVANYSGFCSGSVSTSASIMINPKPNITISTPDPNIFCGTVSPVNMYVASPVTGTAYDWYTTTSSTAITSGTSHTTSVIGSYYVIGENSFGCVDTSNAIAVDTNCVDPCTPKAGSFVDFTKTNLSCNEDSFAGTFSSWATNPVYTFDDIYSGSNTSFGANATHTFTEPGFYRVKLCVKVPDDANVDSCVICTTHVDTINYIPDFIDSIYCEDGMDSLKVKFINNTKILSTAPAPGYAWTINSGSVVSTNANPTFSFVPGTYLITLIVNNVCTISKTITIDPLPNATIIAEDSVCVDAPIQFSSTTTGSIFASEWNFGDGASSLITNPVKTYNPNGVYNVALIVTNSYGCTNSSDTSVTVLPNTLLSSIDPFSDTVFCETDSVVLLSNIASGYPDYDYLWSTVETDTSIVASYTGQYYLEVTDSKGCYSRSNNINVLVNPTPVPDIGGEHTVCLYGQETFAVNYPDGLYTIEWTLNGTLQTWVTQSQFPFYANIIGANMLTVKVISPDLCIGYDTINIEVVPNPDVSITSPGAMCEGETHLLVGKSSSSNIANSYWNNGSVNDSLYASLPGNYTYTVVDSFACSASTSTAIFPQPDFCGLLTGCYELCDTISELVWHAPQGYAGYQWLYNGTAIAGSVYDTLHIPLYQSGAYQLIIATANGCKDTSDVIDIQFTPCAACDISATDSISCGPKDENGNQTYTLLFDIDNTFGPGSIVNIYSLQGSVTAVSPSVIPLGISTVSATFTDFAPIDTTVCFTVTLTYNNDRCGTEVCSRLPDCNSSCEFNTYNACVHCKEETSDGWLYSIELLVDNPFATNAGISVLPIAEGSFGSISPSMVPSGFSTVTIPFSGTEPKDSIICFRILLEHGGRICTQDVCVFLPDCHITGIDPIHGSGNFSVYPNPASNNVAVLISTPGVTENTISIRDINGRIVHTRSVPGSESSIDIDLHAYSPGIYFIGLTNDHYSGSMQLIISGE